jgi:hypothetical protein
MKHGQPISSRRVVLQPSSRGLAAAALSGAQMTDQTIAGAAPHESPEQLRMDPERAFGYLEDICRIGPRPSGSPGMVVQQQLIADHFARTQAQVEFQSFDARHPLNGERVQMSNIIISWNPQATERVLLAAHYDTRPYPDREWHPAKRNGIFIGANDGASGVALFMEMAHQMPLLKPTCGVDFILFDGEELVFGEEGQYFLGSEFFSREYRDNPPAHRYLWGVLVDMIAGRPLQLYQERNSLRYAPDLTRSIWAVARRMGAREFHDRPKHDVFDDHLPLNEIAGIPTCDIIDFDYAHWHTMGDVPANCSGASIATVGNVLLAWLAEVPKPNNQRS